MLFCFCSVLLYCYTPILSYVSYYVFVFTYTSMLLYCYLRYCIFMLLYQVFSSAVVLSHYATFTLLMLSHGTAVRFNITPSCPYTVLLSYDDASILLIVFTFYACTCALLYFDAVYYSRTVLLCYITVM